MKQLAIGCNVSRDEMRVDLEGDSVLITLEASGGERASVCLTSRADVTQLCDALTEWLAEPPAAYLDDKGQLVAIGLEAFESVVWVHDSKRGIPHSWARLVPVRKQL